MTAQPHFHDNARLEAQYVPTGSLKPMPGTPREHPASQIRALTKSIEAFGQVLPIVIDGENRIVSGHALWEVARRLARPEVLAIRIEHLDEAQVKALMVALNRLGDLSKWDDGALRAVLLDLQTVELSFDIEATGFAEIEIELKIHDLDVAAAAGEEEAIIVGEGPTVTGLGDVWQLGGHRLICGDALDEAIWASLMGDERAAIVVTDPPWNVPIDGHVSGNGQHRHREFAMATGELSEAEFTALLEDAMRHAAAWSHPGSVHYWAMDWRHVGEILAAGKAAYERYLNMAVWRKSRPGMGSFYRSQHELFFIFATSGAKIPEQRPARPVRALALERVGLSRSSEPRADCRGG